MKNIYEFKKGDFITKIDPVLDPETGRKDYSLVGKKLEFRGIANASIYLKKDVDALMSMFLGTGNFTIQIPLEIWADGWAYYDEPEFMNDEDGKAETPKNNKQAEIEWEISKAIKDEDFEKASELKEKLKRLKGKS
jgi:hypothetical protein